MLARWRAAGLCAADPAPILSLGPMCLAGLRPLSGSHSGPPDDQDPSAPAGEGADNDAQRIDELNHLMASSAAPHLAGSAAPPASGDPAVDSWRTSSEGINLPGHAALPAGGHPHGDTVHGGSRAKAKTGPPPRPRPPPSPPGESMAMRAFRLHNSSLWGLKGQVIMGRVVQVTHDSVLVDVGFKSFSRFFKHELSGSQVFESGSPGRARGRDDFFVGDVLQVRVECVESPYGNMYLSAQQLQRDLEMDQVWSELQAAHRQGIQVMGRVLNPVNMGFAVGIGGFVGFLPLTRCGLALGRLIGILYPFIILNMDNEKRTFVLQDAEFAFVRRAKYIGWGKWGTDY
ncbi:unnamed protein product [Ostreobium quekettii]|uniref:S1 motif domain-containing protein n=1 Tax=Ostreobium quekettii TaxID=121088 RepID=A0A8S1JDF0_9CHLO|nr:unnamed protein product [Ostreobium quekettii]|eukprot:evm.model.scf_1450.2 EVM.evm.TU.scf_1450.2   scf_1450:22546-24825(+)